MTDDEQQDAKDARLEWLLNEQIGNESPPDLQHAVLDKLQAEQTTKVRPRRGNHVLAAAIALIGIAAVVAVSLLSDPSTKTTANTPQGPDSALLVWKQPKLVRSAKDIESLPIDTLQVFGVDLDDDAMTAMLRLKNLEALALTVSTFERPRAQFLGKKPAPVFVTGSGIERLAALPKLRALVLEGQLKLKGPGIAKLVSNTRVRELKLMNMAVTDDMLRGVCTAPLISLQLHYSQTFGDEGLQAIATCQTLQLIALTGCRHLEDKWIANLSGLKNLEFLDLSLIGSYTMFSGLRVNPLPEEPPGSGVTDHLIEKLAPLPKLRKLMLGVGDISDVGLLALKKFPALRDVSLSSMSEITASGLDSLPDHIETLSLFGHKRVDAKMLEVLLAQPNLQDLNLGYCRGLPANAVDRLCNAKHLRKLDVSGWELNDGDRKRLAALPFDVTLPKKRAINRK